jgi:hypothetical protein
MKGCVMIYAKRALTRKYCRCVNTQRQYLEIISKTDLNMNHVTTTVAKLVNFIGTRVLKHR